MRKSDASAAVKLAIITASILLLSACATKPHPASSPDDQAHQDAFQVAGSAAKSRAEDSVFKDQQVIKPNPGIEKGSLHVSYSMKAVRSEDGYLVQLSLVFRNLKDRNVGVVPHVVLLNDQERRIDAYTKGAFLKFASRAKSGADATSSLISTGSGAQAAQERMAWANSYWLKNKFTISPNGIEIGGLVYRSADLKLPMKLVVNAGNQQYVFPITDPIPVVGEKKGTSRP